MVKFISYVAVTLIVAWGAIYAYHTYWDDVYLAIFDEQNTYSIHLDKVALTVTLADEPAERKQGLSGVAQLDDLEGKLFLFDEEQRHGIWMKDMLLPLDIIWINNDLEVVHIEENVLPESFPDIYGPPVPARYVLEVNAFFVDTYRIELGDRLTIPPGLMPLDVKQRLLAE